MPSPASAPSSVPATAPPTAPPTVAMSIPAPMIGPTPGISPAAIAPRMPPTTPAAEAACRCSGRGLLRLLGRLRFAVSRKADLVGVEAGLHEVGQGALGVVTPFEHADNGRPGGCHKGSVLARCLRISARHRSARCRVASLRRGERDEKGLVVAK